MKRIINGFGNFLLVEEWEEGVLLLVKDWCRRCGRRDEGKKRQFSRSWDGFEGAVGSQEELKVTAFLLIK